MGKQKTNTIANQEMYFISSSSLTQPGFVDHKQTGSALVKKAEEIKEDWDVVITQLNFIISETEKNTVKNGFEMDEVTISLGFTAKGKIAFIAEAGVEASIEVKFKKK